MIQCKSCGKKSSRAWWPSKAHLERDTCDKCLVKKYCAHDFEEYDKWIKNTREKLIKVKRSEGRSQIKELRELLRENQRWKKEMIKDHSIYCLGNMYLLYA
jgi:hypothetical protein|tara:strand:- start:173 stop:475 length:303 start_codon:yes stop_codon:yes gene_type:complete